MNSVEMRIKRIDENDIRIVSHNILSDETSQKRYAILTESVGLLDADVIAFQEYTPNFHTSMNEGIEAQGYSLVIPEDIGLHVTHLSHNTTPMFYKTATLDLIDSGYKRYETVNLTKNISKSYTWGLFEAKSTGKRFIVMGTHMTWVREDFVPSPYELRKRDAIELLEKADELAEKYGKHVPIFLVGDFNAHPETDAFKLIEEKYINSRTCEDIPSRVNIDYGTCYKLDAYPPKNDTGFTIDHIFFSEMLFKPKQFWHVANDFSIRLSDHLPVMLDISLGN